jgi:hypothetical protein
LDHERDSIGVNSNNQGLQLGYYIISAFVQYFFKGQLAHAISQMDQKKQFNTNRSIS